MPTQSCVRVVRMFLKKVMNPLHLGDSLSAEASEGIGGDSLYVAVVLQVTKQQIDQKHVIQK